MANAVQRLVASLGYPGVLRRWKVSRSPLPRQDRRQQPRLAAGRKAAIIWEDEDGNRHLESVQVDDVSAHGLRLTAPCSLRVGQTIWLERTSEPVLKGIVRHCRPQGDKTVVGLLRVASERRRVNRQPVGGKVTVDWCGYLGTPCSTPAVVRDATEFGLQLASPVDVPENQIVRLEGESLEAQGTTCYCVPYNDEYLVGLHFTRQPYQKNTAEYEEEI